MTAAELIISGSTQLTSQSSQTRSRLFVIEGEVHPKMKKKKKIHRNRDQKRSK